MTTTNPDTAGGDAPAGDTTMPDDGDAVLQVPVEAPKKPRASRRIPKSDAVLEAAVERARAAVLEVAPESQIGRHVSAVIEGERLVTHRFEAFMPGYGGWQWYASVARVARSKDVTVCEVGLLPSAASLLAPEWLPWSERVRPEDSATDDAGLPDGAAPAAAPQAGVAGTDEAAEDSMGGVPDASGPAPSAQRGDDDDAVPEAGPAPTDAAAGEPPATEDGSAASTGQPDDE